MAKDKFFEVMNLVVGINNLIPKEDLRINTIIENH